MEDNIRSNNKISGATSLYDKTGAPWVALAIEAAAAMNIYLSRSTVEIQVMSRIWLLEAYVKLQKDQNK